MSEKQKGYPRFSVFQRIEHLILILSFTTLAVTGLPQKFASWPVSLSIIAALGGIETVRIIHHIAAAVFLLQSVYHLVAAMYGLIVKRREPAMLPVVKDALDAWQWLRHNLGLAKEPPRMPRFNFMEKMEYWAMIWGLVLMGITGLMLWNPIATTNFLPGEFIPAAKTAHGGEAVLAVLAIILWHFYNVHIKQFNKSMFTGKISRHEMEEEHAYELERIESGRVAPPPAAAEQRRLRNIFLPAAALTSLALIGGMAYFLTYEQTSITTVPTPENVEVFSPQTPTPVLPTPTEAPLPPIPPGGMTWVDGVSDILQNGRCVACHDNPNGFNTNTYSGVMRAVQPGYPNTSPLIQVQAAGNHPLQLSDAAIDRLRMWVAAGAPQTQPTPTPAGPGTWAAGIEDLFADRCTSCHGDQGGFSAESYNRVMDKVKPGDPDGSPIVAVQKGGDHPGQFSQTELNAIIHWITAGAPQE